MKKADITFIRMANQQISSRKFKSVKELVGYMGAFQAQDYPMSKWAIGLRLEDATEQTINNAIDKGEIIRTHILRPTWHFVSTDDISWMLKLTASKIRTSMSSRNKELELTEAVFKKSNKIIISALSGNNHLTREEIVALLNKAKIKTDNNRASHLLAEAELTGIICGGKSKRNKHTYALLEERVPIDIKMTMDGAASKLAGIYFKSHGPASVQDFSWWSGLNLNTAKKALEMIKHELVSFNSDTLTYWYSGILIENKDKKESVYLLPTYDEYMISYRDRTAVIIDEDHRKVISNNGIFRALIVVNGKITGTWRRMITKDKVMLEFEHFKQPDKKLKQLIEKEAARFGRFLGKRIELNNL